MTDDLTPQGAAAVRLAATVVQLKAERDRARGIAVALEQRLARVEAQVKQWQVDRQGFPIGEPAALTASITIKLCAEEIRAALGADQ